MPSVDMIRRIQIQGSAPGVDQATASLNQLKDAVTAANDNLAKSNAAARANSEGFNIAGLSAATAANHLREAAAAAYVLSPAFRSVVDEMKAPALAATNTALAAVAAGIVTATNYAGTGLIALAGAAERASPALLAYTSTVRTTGIAMEAFNPTVRTAAASLLSFLPPAVGTAAASLASFLVPALKVVGWFALAVDGIKLVGEAWQLGNQKLADYVALSEKAVASGVSTDFYQRIAKAAEDAKLPVDELTAAFKTLQTATADQLGGTTAQNRLKDLVTAGNFGGNTGVGELSNANTIQDKFKAIADLTDQAIQKGQRLAAIDVAKTFLGDAVAGNLAKDSDYLNKMIAAAAEVKSGDLVSTASVDNAVALQNRLDAAEKILSERWHPIQDLLTAGGIAMKGVWVDIVEQIAAAFTQVAKLVDLIAKIPGTEFWHSLQGGLSTGFSMVGRGMMGTGITAPLGAAAMGVGALLRPNDVPDGALAAAKARLASGLGNPANVAASTDQMNSIQNKVFPDTSKDPNAKVPDTTAYDRAIDSVQKYIETTKAAALTVSDAAAEQEKFKVVAELTAAGIKDGLTPAAAAAKAAMSDLGAKAGEAADALAKAKIASQIDFNAKTTFLSSDDVAIATQLKSIYPDVTTALNSVEAVALRVSSSLKPVKPATEKEWEEDRELDHRSKAA